MSVFAGFPSGKVDFIRIPELFFSDLLPQIDHLGELKLTLFALWFLEKQDTVIRFISYQDFVKSSLFALSTTETTRQTLTEAIQRSVERGTLLAIQPQPESFEGAKFFLNTPRGRAAVRAFRAGEWTPDHETPLPEAFENSRPTIYRLYEENIGPLTPLMAETLQDAEDTYPIEWIEEAIVKAVQNNARKWRYVEAILRSWKEKGRYEENG